MRRLLTCFNQTLPIGKRELTLGLRDGGLDHQIGTFLVIFLQAVDGGGECLEQHADCAVDKCVFRWIGHVHGDHDLRAERTRRRDRQRAGDLSVAVVAYANLYRCDDTGHCA